MEEKSKIRGIALAIFILCSFAFAQPLFDLLSRNAEFFLAHKSRPVDILLFAAVLMIAVPAILVLAYRVASVLSSSFSDVVASLILCTLVTLILLPPLKHVDQLPGILLLLIAVSAGAAMAYSFLRFQPVRTYVKYLLPAVVLFPTFFFMTPSISPILLRKNPPYSAPMKIQADTPIIMVVFDELPLVGLMNENLEIDSVRYPNFAALAGKATWFRNATTVSDSTQLAIPAIVTGKYPSPEHIPMTSHYPNTLFSLLQNTYDLTVIEPVSHLCPEFYGDCGNKKRLLIERIGPLLSDVAVIYPHIILPDDFRERLPNISLGWAGFRKNGMKGEEVFGRQALAELKRDRSSPFQEFLNSIRQQDKPSLHFLHILLPHAPYQFLPSGKVYTLNSNIEGLTKETWVDSEQIVLRSYQRFLLQLGYVDVLIGEMLKKLHETGTYDRSLIVVAADHGVSFLPGESRRFLSAANSTDLIAIPLFIKPPFQKQGNTNDRNVEVVDILPTVADLLDIHIPWIMDGASVYGTVTPRTRKVVISGYGEKKRVEFPGQLQLETALQRKVRFFGSGQDNERLYASGPYSSLWGRQSGQIIDAPQVDSRVELRQLQWLENVNLQSTFLPADMTGHIPGKCSADSFLAIALNGRIQSVTQTKCSSNGHSFSAVPPESAFRNGNNQIDFFFVEGTAEEPIFRRLQTEGIPSFTLTSERLLTSADGSRVAIQPGAIRGYLDNSDESDSSLQLSGWAADVQDSSPAKFIVVFVNGKQYYCEYPNVDRPDIVKAFHGPALLSSGFHFALPKALLPENAKIRVFAISKKNIASEVRYPRGYNW